MKKQFYSFLGSVAGAVGVSLPFVASAAEIDLGAFNSAVASGTTATVSMAGTFGTYGILIAVALIAAGIVVYLVVHGARRGKKALNGKI